MIPQPIVLPEAAPAPAKHYTRADLARIAAQAMVARGLTAEYSPQALQQLASITRPSDENTAGIRDLRHLLWCSIDNDDSQDLDQLSVCELLGNGAVKVLVAIADVDTLVKKGSPIDACAEKKHNIGLHSRAHFFDVARAFVDRFNLAQCTAGPFGRRHRADFFW